MGYFDRVYGVGVPLTVFPYILVMLRRPRTYEIFTEIDRFR